MPNLVTVRLCATCNFKSTRVLACPIGCRAERFALTAALASPQYEQLPSASPSHTQFDFEHDASGARNHESSIRSLKPSHDENAAEPNDVETVNGNHDSTASHQLTSAQDCSAESTYSAEKKSEVENEESGIGEMKAVPGKDNYRFIRCFQDWWFWEVGGAMLSLLSMTAAVGVLLRIDQKSLTDWKFMVTPNTFISVCVTVAKTALLLPIAECISQLKWIHFKRRPQRLMDMQIFDAASRGPLGALQLLWTLRARSILATSCALITLTALAYVPSSLKSQLA